MDIPFVYLNLASLLGTEIEVEGYYLWGVLYSVEGDRESLRIALPRHIAREGLLNLNHALHAAEHLTKMILKGRLTQNPLGEPLLDLIDTVRYTNTDRQVDYQAALTYEGNTVTCAMQADLRVQGRKCVIDDLPFQNTPLFASQHLSDIVLLKGYLLSPYRDYNSNLSASVDNLVSNRQDWIKQILKDVLIDFVAIPLGFYWNLRRSGIQAALQMLRGRRHVSFSNTVWIQDEDHEYLDQFFALLIPGGNSHWVGKEIQGLFAGQLAFLDGSERIPNDPYRNYRLKFATLHHVRLSYTITFQRPQDE